MSILKRLVPNSIKQNAKNYLYDILKIPYTKSEIPLSIAQWLPADKAITFIDIGASVGHFTHNIKKHYQLKKVILIEPLQQWVSLLEKKFDDESIFSVINCAIADTNEDIDFYLYPEFDSISSLLKMKQLDELSFIANNEPVLTKVTGRTLDSICADEHLKEIDLVKIDVQGAEHLVLKGAVDALSKIKLIYTEVSFKPLYEGSSTFFDLYNLFLANNFRLVDITKGFQTANGEVLQGDALFVNNALL